MSAAYGHNHCHYQLQQNVKQQACMDTNTCILEVLLSATAALLRDECHLGRAHIAVQLARRGGTRARKSLQEQSGWKPHCRITQGNKQGLQSFYRLGAPRICLLRQRVQSAHLTPTNVYTYPIARPLLRQCVVQGLCMQPITHSSTHTSSKKIPHSFSAILCPFVTSKVILA